MQIKCSKFILLGRSHWHCLVYISYCDFPAFTGGETPQVPLRALIYAIACTWVEPLMIIKLAHMKESKVFGGIQTQRWGASDSMAIKKFWLPIVSLTCSKQTVIDGFFSELAYTSKRIQEIISMKVKIENKHP